VKTLQGGGKSRIRLPYHFPERTQHSVRQKEEKWGGRVIYNVLGKDWPLIPMARGKTGSTMAEEGSIRRARIGRQEKYKSRG